MPIGITITEKSISTTASATGRINRLIFLVTPSGADAALLNQLQAVTSATDLKLKYPSVAEVVEDAIKLVFLNFAQANVLIYACNDTTETDATAVQTHITKGAELLAKRTDLELAYVVCPEMGALADQAERTAVYSAIQSFCEVSDWLFFVNTANVTTTKTEGIAERQLYTSAKGHSSLFYGLITTNDDKTVPVAPVAAAIALKRDQSEAFAPPAGARYPILGVKDLVNYVDNETDYNDLKAQQINVLQKIPRFGTCIWGAQTLATDTKFQLINTRAAVSVTSNRLTLALTPILFQASDPQGRTNREVDRIIISQMTDLWLEGGLSGDTPEDAFRIVDVIVPETNTGAIDTTGADTTAPTTTGTTVTRSVRRVRKQVYARFVEHVEMIEVGLFIVDTLPT